MHLAVQICINELEAQRARIEAALASLREVAAAGLPTAPTQVADVPAAPAPSDALRKPLRAVTAPAPKRPTKAARAAGQAAPAALKSVARTTPVAGGRARRSSDLILQYLLSAAEPQRARAVAAATGLGNSTVVRVLAQLEDDKLVVRAGNRLNTTWRLHAAKPAQASTTSTPRTGTTKVNGAEFEVVFDGGRGQSLTGDYARKGSGALNV